VAGKVGQALQVPLVVAEHEHVQETEGVQLGAAFDKSNFPGEPVDRTFAEQRPVIIAEQL